MTKHPNNPSRMGRRTASRRLLAGSYFYKGIAFFQGFILIPLYFEAFGPRLYGLWVATGGILAWLALFDFNIGQLMQQRVAAAHARRRPILATAYFVHGLVIYGVFAIALVLVGVAVAVPVVRLVGAAPTESVELVHAFSLAVIALAVNVVLNGLSSYQTALQRPTFWVTSLNVCSLFGLVGTVLFVRAGIGVRAIPYGMLIRAVPLFVSNLVYCARLVWPFRSHVRAHMSIMKQYVSLSPALVAGRVGRSIVRQIEPTIIAIMVGPDAAAGYSVLKRAGDVIEGLLHVLLGATYPGYCHLYGSGQVGRAADVMGRILRATLHLGIAAYGVFFLLDIVFVDLWIGSVPQFGNSLMVALIGTGLLLMVLQSFSYSFLVGSGDVATPSMMVLAEATTRIGLMLLLVRTFGIVGTPLAMIISTALGLTLFQLRLRSGVGTSGYRYIPTIVFVVTFVLGLLVLEVLVFPISPQTWTQFAVQTTTRSAVALVLVALFNRDTLALYLSKK